MLEEMVQPQGFNPLQTDYKYESGIINDTVKQRSYNSADMWIYWVKDRSTQGQLSMH